MVTIIFRISGVVVAASILTFLLLVTGSITETARGAAGEVTQFADDFNDGNFDGWSAFLPRTGYPYGPGDWSIDGGILRQGQGGDSFKLILDAHEFGSQQAEVKLKYVANGYGGITVWHADENNWIDVFYYPAGTPNLWIIESIDGIGTTTKLESVAVTDTWYALRVDADSTTGVLNIYLDDNYAGSYTASTTRRFGKTGVNSGNAGGSFDDFIVKSSDVSLLDIAPRDDGNTINVRRTKSVAVAILGTPNFDPVHNINRTTLKFGATGDEESLMSCGKKQGDVNGDGYADLTCSFSVKNTALQCGDNQVILKAELLSGTQTTLTQPVLMTPCNQSI